MLPSRLPRKRHLPLALIPVLVSAFACLAAGQAEPVRAVGCTASSSNKWVGDGKDVPGITGAYSQIEYINRAVCTQGEHFVSSWALSWVSLQALSGPTNIFQGGYARCGIDGACNWNGGTSYVWYFYGHEQGPCGQLFGTGIVKLYNATSGVHDFYVVKSGTHYNFTVDSVVEYQRGSADIDTCWPSGAGSGAWYNEMLNDGDQGGGPNSNHQSFDNNEYQNAAGWHYFDRTLNSLCVDTGTPHWHCQTSGVSKHKIYAWDDRFP